MVEGTGSGETGRLSLHRVVPGDVAENFGPIPFGLGDLIL